MRVHVIGAGLAGAWTVRALLEASPDVRIFWSDREVGPAQRASGNRAGIFKPILTQAETPGSWLSVQAFHRLVSELRSADYARGHFSCEGLVQIPRDDVEAQKFQTGLTNRSWPKSLAHLISANEVFAKTGHRSSLPGVFFPEGGWVSPSGLIHAGFEDLLIRHRTRLLFRWEEEALGPQTTAPGADAFIFCTAEGSTLLEEFQTLKPQVIRGQVSVIRSQKFAIGPTPAAFHEYWAKLPGGDVMIGATHDRGDSGTDPRSEDHGRLLDRIGPDFLKAFEGDPAALHKPLEIRAGLRFGVQGHLPKMGRLPLSSKKWNKPVFALTALGSRGILWAPLLARILAAEVLGHDDVRGCAHEVVQKIRTMVGFQHVI